MQGPGVAGVVTLALGPRDPGTLVAELIAGQPAAFARLFDQYTPFVRRVLLRALGSSWDLDDLVQDTFLRVVQRIRSLRDVSALPSFVASIAVHVARNEMRRRAFRRFVGLEDAPPAFRVQEATDPCDVEGARRLRTVLETLGIERRIAFVLRHVEGYELREGAEIAGCSLATFKRRLSAAEERFEVLCRRDPVLVEYLEKETP
jgi:RNA polymerase sigma-70 factor, ECF subfamily